MPAVVGVLLGAGVVDGVRHHRERAVERMAAQEWQAVRQSGSTQRAAFPPDQTTAAVRLLAETQGPAPMASQLRAVGLVAELGADHVPKRVLALAAAGTASLLGEEGADPRDWDGSVRDRLSRQERLRAALARLCGECAPPPAAASTHWRIPPRTPLQAERALRAGVEVPAMDPLAAVAAAVRAGDPIDKDELQQPGLAGLASLELARMGPSGCAGLLADAPPLPSAADALALAYARKRCEEESP